MENELKIEAEKLSPQEQFMLRKQIVALRKGGETTAEVVELITELITQDFIVWLIL